MAIAIIGGIAALALAIVLIPGLLVWLISIGILAMFLIGILVVLVIVVMTFLSMGMGFIHLLKKHEVQGPEMEYELDMVKTPKRENR